MTTPKLLGQGTYGNVYKIKANISGKEQDYAIKVFRDVEDLFVSLPEIDVLFRVKNEGILKGYQVFSETSQQDGVRRMSVVEDLVTGDITDFHKLFYRSTFELTEREEKLLLEKIVTKMIIQVCCAIECLWKAGYYHYDLKSDNIFFKAKSKIKSVDDINFYAADYNLLIKLDYPQQQEYEYRNNAEFIGAKDYLSPILKRKIFTKEKTTKLTYSLQTWNILLSAVYLYLGQQKFDKFLRAADNPEKLMNFFSKKFSTEELSSEFFDMIKFIFYDDITTSERINFEIFYTTRSPSQILDYLQPQRGCECGYSPFISSREMISLQDKYLELNKIFSHHYQHLLEDYPGKQFPLKAYTLGLVYFIWCFRNNSKMEVTRLHKLARIAMFFYENYLPPNFVARYEEKVSRDIMDEIDSIKEVLGYNSIFWILLDEEKDFSFIKRLSISSIFEYRIKPSSKEKDPKRYLLDTTRFLNLLNES